VADDRRHVGNFGRPPSVPLERRHPWLASRSMPMFRGACPCCPWGAMALGPGDQQRAYRPCRSMWARGAWCGDGLVPAALPRGFLSSRIVSCYRSRFTRAFLTRRGWGDTGYNGAPGSHHRGSAHVPSELRRLFATSSGSIGFKRSLRPPDAPGPPMASFVTDRDVPRLGTDHSAAKDPGPRLGW